jgi:hypothetical protein
MSPSEVLYALAALPENWDGYGALHISAETIHNARRALNVLAHAPLPEITPNPNGTISFEWETESSEAHLEIGKTRYSFYAKTMDHGVWLQNGNIGALDEQERIVRILNQVLQDEQMGLP